MPILQGSYGYRKEKGANQSNNLEIGKTKSAMEEWIRTYLPACPVSAMAHAPHAFST
jgi:hypothetical protein